MIDPPSTVKIASINPPNGNPVCCIGIVVAKAFNEVDGFIGVIVLFPVTLTVIGSTALVLML